MLAASAAFLLGIGSASAAVEPSTPSRASLARPLAPVADVTADTGATVVGEVASWVMLEGLGLRQISRLAGRSPAGDLLVFSLPTGAGRWQVQNVSSRTGQRIAGPVTAWLTPDGPYRVEHLAGVSPAGNLLVFYRSTRNNQWKVVDVTAKTGRRLAADRLTSWLTPNGPYTVEHLAGRDALGNVLVFWWSPARDWQVVDVSAKTGGRRVVSPLASWQARIGGVLHEYLAGSAADDTVTLFSFAPGRDWRAQRLGSLRFRGGVTAWQTGSVEHLGGAAPDGSLWVIWRTTGQTLWKSIDVTAITGERVQGRPTVYQLRDGNENVEVLASMGSYTGRRLGSNLVVHWWKPSRDWQALSLTEITGHAVTTRPESWLARSGLIMAEHLATVGTDGHLRVFHGFDQPRRLTDAVGRGYESIKRMRGVRRKVLVVLWDPHYPDVPTRPTSAQVAQTVFGVQNSVRGFFQENSGGAFAMDPVAGAPSGTLGWYEAEHPLSYYDNPTNPRDKMGAALRAADPDFDFGAYDANRNGRLEPSELGLVFVHPGGPGGLVRAGSRRITDPNGGGNLVLDGVRIDEGVELGIGEPANLGIVAHELSHLLLGLPDMYFTFFTPTAAGAYSIMDNTYSPWHLDPFNKLKLGWLQPRLVFRSGRYTIPDVETRRRVLVLVDPNRGADEYFLVENRWPGTTYDAGLPDRGLGVWHVMEKRETYDAAPPPSTVAMTDWAALGSGGWGRKAIQMVRPILTRPFDNARALWDGTDPATGYDLVSNDPDPLRSSLKWGNVTPSGFALRSFGAPGRDMAVTITVPAW